METKQPAATLESESTQKEHTTINKKQRGRLKKLRRRSQEDKEGCETTGISSISDWNELLELDPTSKVVPSVRLRRIVPHGTSQNADGADHRDIILQTLQRTHQIKKRGSIEMTAKIPAWARLHNICSTKSLAVIEIHMSDVNCDLDSLLSNISVLTRQAAGKEERSILPVKTRWFQGPSPKSITSSLLYFSSLAGNISRKKKKGSTDSDLMTQTVDVLNKLSLTAGERLREGYPIIERIDTTEKSSQPRRIAPTSLPTADEANWVVKKYHVIVPNQKSELLGNFVTSRNYSLDNPRVFALDCEMVMTSVGVELARITLVQLQRVDPIMHTVVLDELVKPDRPILDYVTKYSGITPDLLGPVKTRLEQIQAFLVQLLTMNDILIGHSLENDLLALRLVHDQVVDTSVLFRGKSGRKYSLRHLSASLLNRIIQNEEGHCSEEDAVASLELAIRRAQEGPSFCIYEASENQVHLLECVKFDQEKPVVCIGPSSWLKTHVTPFGSSAHALTCESVEDTNRKAVSAWLVKEKRRAKLVWANLIVKGDKPSMDALDETLTDLILRSLSGTIILIAFQKGYSCAFLETEQRHARMNPRASLAWTQNDEEKWEEICDRSRFGYALWVG